MKRIIFILIVFITTITFVTISFYYCLNKDDNKSLNSKDNLISIKSKYNDIVTITSDTNLYKKDKNYFIKIGTVTKDTVLELEKVDIINEDDLYFRIKNSNYYVGYNDVKPYKEKMFNDESYKNYLSTKSIKTNESFNVYLDDKKAITINEPLEFDVLMIDNDMYYVFFLNKLVGINKNDISKINNKLVKKASSIPILNYHFFYDPKTEKCSESICISKDLFEDHLKYLKENNYYTATVKDIALWMNKKIELPINTVVITVDDGALGTNTHLIRLLEKYDLKGTLFLITGWWSKDKYKSNNLDIQSHGDDIHLENYCNGVSRGAKGLCLSKDKLIKDLEKSIKKLEGEHTSFCYPFYLYSDTMISALKEVGFSIAFTGGERKVTRNDNKYKIPRFIIYNGTTTSELKKILNS